MGVAGIDSRAGAGSGFSIDGADVERALGLVCRIKASRSLIFFSNLACEALVSSRKRLMPDSDRLYETQLLGPRFSGSSEMKTYRLFDGKTCSRRHLSGTPLLTLMGQSPRTFTKSGFFLQTHQFEHGTRLSHLGY